MTKRFGKKSYIDDVIYTFGSNIAAGEAMTTLRLYQVVDETFVVLAQKLNQAEREHLACHGLECMREVLQQVVLREPCIERQRALDFLGKTLLLLKGRLMAWNEMDLPEDAVDLPLPTLPQKYWESKHPSAPHFVEDAAVAVSTMQQYPMAFEGQPWQWLSDLYMDVQKTRS